MTETRKETSIQGRHNLGRTQRYCLTRPHTGAYCDGDLNHPPLASPRNLSTPIQDFIPNHFHSVHEGKKYRLAAVCKDQKQKQKASTSSLVYLGLSLSLSRPQLFATQTHSKMYRDWLFFHNGQFPGN